MVNKARSDTKERADEIRQMDKHCASFDGSVRDSCPLCPKTPPCPSPFMSDHSSVSPGKVVSNLSGSIPQFQLQEYLDLAGTFGKSGSIPIYWMNQRENRP